MSDPSITDPTAGEPAGQVSSDPTAGERARQIGAHPGQPQPVVDPTDPRYGTVNAAARVERNRRERS